MPVKIAVQKRVSSRFRRPVVHFIKEWRKYRDLSLERLGAMSNVSPSMISQLETGKTTYTQITIEKIAKALEVEPWQLLVCDDPGANADLWRIVATLDHPDMKTVLRQYAERRSNGERDRDPNKGASI